MSAAPIRNVAATAVVILTAALLLPGCSAKVHDKDGNEQAVISIGGDGANGSDDAAAGNGAKAVSIDVPGFSAKVTVPDLDLGGNDTDIDGLRFYPGTKVNGVKVLGDASDGSGGESKGQVDMAFTAPVPPDQLLGYYKGEAQRSGWKEEPAPGGTQFAATKSDDKGKLSHLTITMTAAATGSTGSFHLVGQ